jgi:type VI protein secretion system component Hcp
MKRWALGITTGAMLVGGSILVGGTHTARAEEICVECAPIPVQRIESNDHFPTFELKKAKVSVKAFVITKVIDKSSP